MKNEQIQKTMRGAVILSCAGLAAKILSAFYRIPFQNIVGNTGFYVYQQVYPIYGIGMTFALSGFPVYISKLIAEQENELHRLQLSRQIFLVLACFGIFVFAFLQFFSKQIAFLMGDSEFFWLIKSISWMFLFMPMLAVPRGYYQGTFNMIPPALSQVAEQFVRVLVIIVCAAMFAKCDWNLYSMGANAMLGSTFGAFFAMICMSSFYFKKFFKARQSDFHEDYSVLFKKIFTEGLVLCLFAAMMVLLQLVDSFTVMNGLRLSGMSLSKAQNLKGAYDRAQPLVQLGMALATGFSASLLPALSSELAEKKVAEFKETTKIILRISTVIALAATVGMISIMPELNTLLFGDAFLSSTISAYVVSIVFIALISTYNSILQSMNLFSKAAFSLLCGIFVKACTNVWLIGQFGIIGASISTVLALAVSLALIVFFKPKSVGSVFTGDSFMTKLGAACLLMGGSVKALMILFEKFSAGTRFDAVVATSAGIILGCFVFFFSIVAFDLFEKDEWLAFPKGKKIYELVQKLRK